MLNMMFSLFLLAALMLGNGFAQTDVSPQQAKATYVKADRALNEAWAAAKKALSEVDFNALKESQRTWVAHRDYLARSPMFTGADGQGELALDSQEYLGAAAELADMRTVWLRGLIREPADENLTGEWTDSYGGSIEIVEREGHLHFTIQCVRGPTSHVGGLAGSAVWNQSIGWYSDKGRDKDKTDETNLSFNLRERKLEVIGANTGYYHGARAYFDGSYVKVSPLSAKVQAKTLKAAKSGELSED